MRRNVTALPAGASTVVKAALMAVMALVIVIATVAGCSSSGDNKPGATSPSTPGSADGHHGPMFPQCGGISDQVV